MQLTNTTHNPLPDNTALPAEPHETKQLERALALAENALSQLYFSGHNSDSFSLASATLLAESADHQAVCLKGCSHTHWLKELLYRIHQARGEARLIGEKKETRNSETREKLNVAA